MKPSDANRIEIAISDFTEKDGQRLAAAYHEAGHAVVALFLNCEVSPEGVEIDNRQYAGIRIRPLNVGGTAAVYEVSACIDCAGWLSEWNKHRLGQQYRDISDLEFAIDCPDEIDGEDLARAMTYLRALHPTARKQGLIRRFRDVERRVAEMLAKPAVWSCIEAVAAALLVHGKLDPSQVEELAEGLPPPPSWGINEEE